MYDVRINVRVFRLSGSNCIRRRVDCHVAELSRAAQKPLRMPQRNKRVTHMHTYPYISFARCVHVSGSSVGIIMHQRHHHASSFPSLLETSVDNKPTYVWMTNSEPKTYRYYTAVRIVHMYTSFHVSNLVENPRTCEQVAWQRGKRKMNIWVTHTHTHLSSLHHLDTSGRAYERNSFWSAPCKARMITRWCV